MSVTTILVFLVTAATPAIAHGDGADAPAVAAPWTFDPWIMVPLCASAALYLVGTGKLWRHAGNGRGVHHWQAMCFWFGWAVLVLALLSPLHWLGERLFVAHMIEHEALMIAAAPLVALARPLGAFLWALPAGWRRGLGRLVRVASIAAAWRALRAPLVATLVHGVALWLWHMPGLFNMALVSDTMHRLQHLSFFLSALLFWWSLFYGPQRQHGDGVAVACLFITSLHSAILGILLTLARQPWYPQQGDWAAICGLTALEDQQLAGLVMWVPPGIIYLSFALHFAARWISGAGGRTGGRHALAPR